MRLKYINGHRVINVGSLDRSRKHIDKIIEEGIEKKVLLNISPRLCKRNEDYNSVVGLVAYTYNKLKDGNLAIVCSNFYLRGTISDCVADISCFDPKALKKYS